MLDILELSEETVTPTSTRMTELFEALGFSEVSVVFVPVRIKFSGTLTAALRGTACQWWGQTTSPLSDCSH